MSGLTFHSHNSEILSRSPFSSERKQLDLREEIIQSPSPNPKKEKDFDSVVGTPLNLDSTKVKSFQSPLEIEDDKAPQLASKALQDKIKLKSKRRVFEEIESQSQQSRSEIIASEPGVSATSQKKRSKKSGKKAPFSSIDVIEQTEKSVQSASSKKSTAKVNEDGGLSPTPGSSLAPKRFTEVHEASSIISFKSFGSKGASLKGEEEKQPHAPSPMHSLASREAPFRVSGSQVSNYNGTPSFAHISDRPPSLPNPNNHSLSRFHQTLTAPAHSCVTSPVKNTSSSFLPIRSAKTSSTALHQVDLLESSVNKKSKTANALKYNRKDSQISEALHSATTDRVPEEKGSSDHAAASCAEIKRELQNPSFQKPSPNQFGVKALSGDRGSASISAHNFDTSVSSFPPEKISSRKSEVTSPIPRHSPQASFSAYPKIKGLQREGALKEETEEESEE